LLWPKNTVFDRGRFTQGHQCQSCGHAIHNPYNWVPLLIDSQKGIPHALWVGRDCSASVFGVKVTGEVIIENNPRGKS